jgi:transposase InsO family protein
LKEVKGIVKKLWKRVYPISIGILCVGLLFPLLIPIAEAADNPPWVSPIQVSPIASDGKTVSGDVQISVTAGELYLATVIDLYSRKIVGWTMKNPCQMNG